MLAKQEGWCMIGMSVESLEGVMLGAEPGV